MNYMNYTKGFLSFVLLSTLLLGAIAGCSQQGAQQAGQGEHAGHAYQLAPLVQMPPVVQQAPATVREAYQFATFNQGVLSELPCYCGCGAMGHTSNYSCYVSGSDEGGQLVYDNHALGCSICVDITQDAMRMLDEGKSVEEIYDYVEETYSRFGPPTPLS